jgi:putative hydrolase of the HAD superfamily
VAAHHPAFADRLGPIEATVIAAAIEAATIELWADPAQHKCWRHRIGDARRRIVASAFATLAAAGHAMPPQAIGDALADAYNALHDEELAMFPDAHKTLDRLKELGGKLALITNGAAQPQRAKVVRFALEHRFDHIQIEGEHGFGKPEERAYKYAMEVAPSRPARDLDGRRQPRMGSRHPATSRHLRDLARRLRRRPALRLPIRPDRIICRLSELLL